MLIESSFKPAWWASNRHFQTIWGALRFIPTLPKMQRLRLELDDGDFIDVDLHKNSGNLPSVSVLGRTPSLIHLFFNFKTLVNLPPETKCVINRAFNLGLQGCLPQIIESIRI